MFAYLFTPPPPPPVFYPLIQPWWAEDNYSTNTIKTWSIVMSFHSHQIECTYFTSTGAIWLKTLYMFQFMTTFFTVSIATKKTVFFSLAAYNLECLKCFNFTVCLFESLILKIIHSIKCIWCLWPWVVYSCPLWPLLSVTERYGKIWAFPQVPSTLFC